MRSKTAIFLLPIFLFGSLVPGQAQEELTRMPVLWGHYQTHREQVPGTTFSQYLQLHYGGAFAQHRSAHDHSNLPLKSGENHLHAPSPVDLPQPTEVALQIVLTDSQPPVCHDQIVLQAFLSNIWQPPKSC